MPDTMNKESKRSFPFFIMMWVAAILGILHCVIYIIHISGRLSELDDFDKSSRWLGPSVKEGDWYWKQYMLDLIERVFIYFSIVAIALAVVSLLLMCIFKTKIASLVWAVAAPASLFIFTVTQGDLFSSDPDRAMRKEMLFSTIIQLLISIAIVIYIFGKRKYFNSATFFSLAVLLSFFLTYRIGNLAIHREESIGWCYSSSFIALVMICITHLGDDRHKVESNEDES